jgi:hypothetical protein
MYIINMLLTYYVRKFHSLTNIISLCMKVNINLFKNMQTASTVMFAYYEPGYSELLVITNQFDKYELKFHKMCVIFSRK